VVAKVADFGMACMMTLEGLGGALRSWEHVAPEIFANATNLYDETTDVYSFALILWQLVCGKVAFEEFLSNEQYSMSVSFGDKLAEAVVPVDLEFAPSRTRGYRQIPIKQAIADGLRPTIPDIYALLLEQDRARQEALASDATITASDSPTKEPAPQQQHPLEYTPGDIEPMSPERAISAPPAVSLPATAPLPPKTPTTPNTKLQEAIAASSSSSSAEFKNVLEPALAQELEKLIAQCWHPDSRQRPSFNSIMPSLAAMVQSLRIAPLASVPTPERPSRFVQAQPSSFRRPQLQLRSYSQTKVASAGRPSTIPTAPAWQPLSRAIARQVNYVPIGTTAMPQCALVVARHLWIAFADGIVRVYNLTEHSFPLVTSWKCNRFGIAAITVVRSSVWILACSGDIQVWDAKCISFVTEFNAFSGPHADATCMCRIIGDTDCVWIGTAKSEIRIFHSQTYKPIAALTLPNGAGATQIITSSRNVWVSGPQGFVVYTIDNFLHEISASSSSAITTMTSVMGYIICGSADGTLSFFQYEVPRSSSSSSSSCSCPGWFLSFYMDNSQVSR